MLSKLKAAIGTMGQPVAAAVPSSEPVRLACAALLARIAQLDGRLDKSEGDAMLRLMVDRFSIEETEASAVLDDATEHMEASNDIYRYTKVLRSSFDEAERITLMEMFWEVVYADGELHEFEAQLMRRLAGLLYVDDRDSGAARKRAIKKLGLAG